LNRTLVNISSVEIWSSKIIFS